MHPWEGPKGVSETFCGGDERMKRTFFFMFENGAGQLASGVAASESAQAQ